MNQLSPEEIERIRTLPVTEEALPQPRSPYGVTKLAAEHLCSLYAANFGVSAVSLRYFTVYGPRQRPDMATYRLFESALGGDEFPLFGTGAQLRDFTFVGDVVAANLLAHLADTQPDGGFDPWQLPVCRKLELDARRADELLAEARRAQQILDIPATLAVAS